MRFTGGLVALFALGLLASGALGQAMSGAGTSGSTDTSAPAASSSSSTDTTAATSTDGSTTTDRRDDPRTTTTSTDTTPSVTTPSGTSSRRSRPRSRATRRTTTPGETVTLTGSGWGPGESVHLFVNDSDGQTWSYSADVAADLTGGFTQQFQLPDWFVANYSVTATGAGGETTTSTFTDSKVSNVPLRRPRAPRLPRADPPSTAL